MVSDYISREAVLARLKRIIEVNRLRTDMAWFTPDGVEYLINEPPAADVRPVVKAQWAPNVPHRDLRPRCTACGMLHPVRTSFCPNCGADMREES